MHFIGWDAMTLTSVKRLLHILPALLLATGTWGCVTGKVLTLHEGPARPAGKTVSKAEATAPAVAVLDFSWEENPSSEVGRDFDHVRSIVWIGNPGKAMADLVAAVLAEKGIPAVRAGGDADVPAGVSTIVRGRVEKYRVDVRRSKMVAVDIEAAVALKIHGSAPGAPPGWSSDVSSAYGYSEPLFVTSGEIINAFNRAANAVAEEGVRRFMESGLVAPK